MEDSRRAPRRRHAADDLKSRVLRECAEPGASVARVALTHGLNANLVHKWRRQAERGSVTAPVVRSSQATPTRRRGQPCTEADRPAADPLISDRIVFRRAEPLLRTGGGVLAAPSKLGQRHPFAPERGHRPAELLPSSSIEVTVENRAIHQELIGRIRILGAQRQAVRK